MGTLIKYLFYLILIVVIYLVGRGIYEGQINEQTTVGEVVDQVESGTKGMVQATDNAVKNQIKEYKEAPKTEVTIEKKEAEPVK